MGKWWMCAAVFGWQGCDRDSLLIGLPTSFCTTDFQVWFTRETFGGLKSAPKSRFHTIFCIFFEKLVIEYTINLNLSSQREVADIFLGSRGFWTLPGLKGPPSLCKTNGHWIPWWWAVRFELEPACLLVLSFLQNSPWKWGVHLLVFLPLAAGMRLYLDLPGTSRGRGHAIQSHNFTPDVHNPPKWHHPKYCWKSYLPPTDTVIKPICTETNQ